MVIVLRGSAEIGWYWQVRQDQPRMVIAAGYASTMIGAWWKATRARRAAPQRPFEG